MSSSKSHLNQPQFRTPEHARLYLEHVRWPDGPICPHCGSVSKDHYPLAGETTREGLWKCKDCREPFTVTVGTLFERSKIKLNVWLQAVYLLCCSKKGMSSHQLHRILGVQYKTAWFMTHRIREAFKTSPTGPLGGAGKIVEADETYFGTENGQARHNLKGAYGNRARGANAMNQMNKIVALVERNGDVRSFHDRP
jgi:transposase-like protein